LEINVLAGKRPPLLYRGLLCGVARRPEINGLAANQEVGLAISVPLAQDVAECFEGKTHERQLRTRQTGLVSHGLQHLAQVGNLAFHAVCQRVSSFESKRCPPALTCAPQIDHALAGLGALDCPESIRAHSQNVTMHHGLVKPELGNRYRLPARSFRRAKSSRNCARSPFR
jgi:hypothetical protein